VPFTGPNAFVIMNGRLLNNPVPPREIDPAISPQLQEIIYRALERDPSKRYASSREFAWDLEHQDQVGWREAVFIGAILTATSVSITAQTLMSMNQLRVNRVGR
jgi:serine/threonine protein kinase